MNMNYFQYCHRKGKEPKCMLQIIIVECHGYEKNYNCFVDVTNGNDISCKYLF